MDDFEDIPLLFMSRQEERSLAARLKRSPAAMVSTPEIDAMAWPSFDVVAPRSTGSNEIATINTSLTLSR